MFICVLSFAGNEYLSFEESIRRRTTDKIHRTFDVSHIVVKAALSVFGIGCIVENNVPKSRYYILQKYAGAVCFRCRSRSHDKRHCHGSV